MFQSIVSKFNSIIFFSLLGVVIFLLDLYAWQGFRTISRDWTSRSRNLLFYSYWAVSLFFVVMVMLRPFFHIEQTGNPLFGVVQAFGFIFIFTKLVIAIPLMIEDIYRLFEWLIGLFAHKESEHIFHSRRKFISLTGIGLGSLPFVGLTYGIVKGAHNYRIRKLNLTFKELPKSFDGIKIVQLSDIHSGSFWNRSAVEGGVQMVKELNADLILFTGDLVNSKADEMDSWKSLFGSISAPMGIFSILGNHDYGDYIHWNSAEEKAANLEKLKRTQAEMGWKMLNNTSIMLQKGGESIEIVGVENWSAKPNFPKYGDLSKALSESANLPFQILLSHDPSHWRAQVLEKHKNIKLTLSGHTHGFQFGIETHGLKWSPIKYMYPEWAGLYKQDAQYLYVNRGFGYLGYPGRLGIDPEITLITLKSDS
ncbi:MAG: metallophosphoesterase [Bacteroidetes bacterium]|nr:metallophosphoesterase [Bacteroidota bacterium]